MHESRWSEIKFICRCLGTRSKTKYISTTENALLHIFGKITVYLPKSKKPKMWPVEKLWRKIYVYFP